MYPNDTGLVLVLVLLIFQPSFFPFIHTEMAFDHITVVKGRDLIYFAYFLPCILQIALYLFICFSYDRYEVDSIPCAIL